MAVIRREFVYIWFYFSVQLEQILPYWIIGIVIGSIVSVFAKDRIHRLFAAMGNRRWGVLGILPASLLGIASPLCMYGTIPIAASFANRGMRQDWLAAFMMSSVLLNPQLLIYSAALGTKALVVRFASCLLCGVAAGLLVRAFCRDGGFFRFDGFDERQSRDTDRNLLLRLLKNIGRNLRATGLYFFIGILLSALFARYVPSDAFSSLFAGNRGFGVLMAATVGVPLYVCGGGTIPLLQEWLARGMSLGSATAFMITGPATKITNLGALKMVVGNKRFVTYLLYVLGFSLASGLLVDLIA